MPSRLAKELQLIQALEGMEFPEPSLIREVEKIIVKNEEREWQIHHFWGYIRCDSRKFPRASSEM